MNTPNKYLCKSKYSNSRYVRKINNLCIHALNKFEDYCHSCIHNFHLPEDVENIIHSCLHVSGSYIPGCPVNLLQQGDYPYPMYDVDATFTYEVKNTLYMIQKSLCYTVPFVGESYLWYNPLLSDENIDKSNELQTCMVQYVDELFKAIRLFDFQMFNDALHGEILKFKQDMML